MLAVWVVLAASAGALVWLIVPPLLRARRNAQLAQQKLPRATRRILARQLPLYKKLARKQRQQLDGQIQIFLADKTFHGCAGLEIDETIRLTIAGHACLLCLRPDADCFASVHSILVYPSAFYVKHEFPDEFGLVDESPDLLAGEAWDAGRVILAWDNCEAAAQGADSNVIVHEFAHQLDFDNPAATGAPALADYADWSRVFSRELEQLRGQDSPVLDDYGATNPAEFFAVATESYFQRGARLAEHHAELYRLLRDYYGLDTAAH